MTRRIGWDHDDEDFEILNHLLPKNNRENFELIEDDSFEIIPPKSKPTSILQTNLVAEILSAAPSTDVNRPVGISTDVNRSVGSSTDVNPPVGTSTQLPIRYGTAALIPHSQPSDYQSILTRQPYRPLPKNNLLDLLQQPSKPKTPLFTANKLQELVSESDQDRRSLVELAKQSQKDFLSSIQMD